MRVAINSDNKTASPSQLVGDTSWDIFTNSTLNEIINQKLLDLFKCEFESRDLKYDSQNYEILQIISKLESDNSRLLSSNESINQLLSQCHTKLQSHENEISILKDDKMKMFEYLAKP